MSDEVVIRLAVLGLQSTGKTTYLTAFFIACDRAADGLAITQYGLGDRDFLNKRADELGACRPVERTPQNDPSELRLMVRLEKGQPEQELVVPDLSGELLRESMNDRSLDTQILDQLSDASAHLLFLRVDRMLEAKRLADFAAALRAAGEELAGEPLPETPDWTVELAATQVRLTDVMQELVRLDYKPSRLAVVLSAWDQRKDEHQTPEEWAREHLGLLTQWLMNSGIEWTAFGVSAQGGDFGDVAARELLEGRTLAERPFVQAADGTIAGIGEPLKWALRAST